MPPGEETVTTRAGFEQLMFEEWAKGRLRFTDVAAAQKKLPFALKMPDPSLVASPAMIYVRKASKIAPAEAHIIFGPEPSEAVQLIAVRSRRREDFEALVAQDEADHASGLARSDKKWQLMRVNGNEAIGIEPGVNNGAPIRWHDRPGVIRWRDGDTVYVLYGTKGQDGTPLAELLKIAESMY